MGFRNMQEKLENFFTSLQLSNLEYFSFNYNIQSIIWLINYSINIFSVWIPYSWSKIPWAILSPHVIWNLSRKSYPIQRLANSPIHQFHMKWFHLWIGLSQWNSGQDIISRPAWPPYSLKQPCLTVWQIRLDTPYF